MLLVKLPINRPLLVVKFLGIPKFYVYFQHLRAGVCVSVGAPNSHIVQGSLEGNQEDLQQGEIRYKSE